MHNQSEISVPIMFFREYGAIDDVDIDLHIDVSFLDVSNSKYKIF